MKAGEVVGKRRKSSPQALRLQVGVQCGGWGAVHLKASTHKPQALITTFLTDCKALVCLLQH